MQFIDALPQLPMDAQSTLARFSGNTALLEKFVRRFPQDPTLSDLEAAVSAENWVQAQRSAHTLKGVAANLGFNELAERCSELVATLRVHDPAPAPRLMEEIRQAHRHILAALAILDEA